MQTGPPRMCCQISQKNRGCRTPPDAPAACLVGLPKPSLRRSGSRCNGKKKPPPPVWPASDLKKGMTSACTSRGASVRGRGPFHSGPHPQESEWGSCQALSTVLMDSAPPPSWVAAGGEQSNCLRGGPTGIVGARRRCSALGGWPAPRKCRACRPDSQSGAARCSRAAWVPLSPIRPWGFPGGDRGVR